MKRNWRQVLRATYVGGIAGQQGWARAPYYAAELECGHAVDVPVYELGRRGGVRSIRPGPPGIVDCVYCDRAPTESDEQPSDHEPG